MEESILWWSQDQARWQPLEEEILPRQRRWIVVETEDGYRAKAGDQAAVAELLETVGLEQQQSQLGAANLNLSN